MDDLIRIGAAATALGVSIDTLRRWERDGRVRFERRSQQRWMSSDELARLLRERASAGSCSRCAATTSWPRSISPAARTASSRS
jgi:predicted site-specific integrase-resolvase